MIKVKLLNNQKFIGLSLVLLWAVSLNLMCNMDNKGDHISIGIGIFFIQIDATFTLWRSLLPS